MAQNPPLVFSHITPAQYSTLVEKAKAQGINLSSNSGTVSKFGVQVAWNYSPESEQLSLQCLRTPIFVSAGDVHARLQVLVQQSLAAS